MRKAILRTILFLIILIIFILLTLSGTDTIIKDKAYISIKPNSKFIVLGHSHPQLSLNDSLITNFSNCAAGGEGFFYTYFKVKEIIEQNNNIEVVFIEFSNNQIIEKMDDWTWGKENLSTRYPLYAPFLEFKDHMLLFEKNSIGFCNALSLSLNKNFNTIIFNNYNFSELRIGYMKKEGSKLDSLMKVYKNKGRFEKYKSNISLVNIKYLKKIIKVCQDNNKKVFIIRCPITKISKVLQNEKIYRKYLATTCKISKIEFLDFINFPLKNSEFYDTEHLNSKGAVKFSKWFNELLIDGFLNRPHKQKYIDEKIYLLH